MKLKTTGISPKVFAPAGVLLVAVLVQWIATGDWDRVLTGQAVGVALLALVGYMSDPGVISAAQKTIGISPKVLAPAAALFVTLIVTWIQSGVWDRVQSAEAVGVALLAVIGYFAPPGDVVEAKLAE